MCPAEAVSSNSAAMALGLRRNVDEDLQRASRCTKTLERTSGRWEMTAKGTSSLSMAAGWWSMLPDGVDGEGRGMSWRRREAKASLQQEASHHRFALCTIIFAQLHTIAI